MRHGSMVRSVLVATLAVVAAPTELRAQAFEQQQLLPSGSGSIRHGAAIDVEADVMVVGAPFHGGAAEGAVYVYGFDATTSQWLEEQVLVASDPEAAASFGASVAIDGDAIVVGAPLKDESAGADAGAIYVFRPDASTGDWIEEQKLVPSFPAADQRFGVDVDVDVDGYVLIAGADGADTSAATDAGAAVVFAFTASTLWFEQANLLDPSAEDGDRAGLQVAIDGTTAAIGIPFAKRLGKDEVGAVAVWTTDGTSWTHAQDLHAVPVEWLSGFGTGLDLEGDALVVGEPLENDGIDLDVGAARVFRHDGTSWNEEALLRDPDKGLPTNFGQSVAIDGDRVVVGANFMHGPKLISGAAWIFRNGRRSGWVADAQIAGSDSRSVDQFGAAVAIDAGTIACGAPFFDKDKTTSRDFGAVYVFDSAEITLAITPEQPAPGAAVELEAHRGAPNEVVLLTVEDVGGVPLFLPLFVSVFDDEQRLALTVNAPTPALGVRVGMRAWKVSSTGPLVFSALAFVDV